MALALPPSDWTSDGDPFADESGNDHRLPPISHEAERAVLGSLLLAASLEEVWREVSGDVLPLLKPGDFHRTAHATIYAAVLACHARGDAPDYLTVGAELEARGKAEAVGGESFLAELHNAPVTALNAAEYARTVRRLARRRRLITLGREVTALGDDPDPDAALAKLRALVAAVEDDGRAAKPYVTLGEALSEYCDHLGAAVQARHDLGVALVGTDTGLSDLNAATGGWRPGELTIVAGRPGHGKSALMMGMALAAARSRAPVGFFSLEMSRLQLCQRIVANESGVDGIKLRQAWVDQDELGRAFEASGELDALPILLDDTRGIALHELRAKAGRMKAEHQIAGVFVDYLQLMQGPDAGGRRGTQASREQEVGAISRGLVALAGELGIWVVAASQLNRAVESRPGHRPQLSDLRESGSLEQDAHQVLFVHREEVLDPQTPRKNLADLILAKNRMGPTVDVVCRWNGPRSRFEGLAEGYRP